VHKNIPRPATPTDLSQVQAVVAAAYAKYAERMEEAPAPVYRVYAEAIDHELVWVIGDPIRGLISLVPADDARRSRTLPYFLRHWAPAWDAD
jgi:hypothetical protein